MYPVEKRELIALGDKAMVEERTENAIAYYRMSEFLMYDGDPDKKKYYEKATAITVPSSGSHITEVFCRRC